EQPRDAGGYPSIAQAGWYLETVDEGGALRRVWIRALPFRIGRRHGLELYLAAESVSKSHAEIYAVGSTLRLRDLGSRNGTFLNRALVEDAALGEGDVLHFADFEFRIGRSDMPEVAPLAPGKERPTTAANKGPRQHRFEKGTRELRELLREGLVTTVFQPIVLLSRGTVVAYEALGRGRHPQLDESPLELLRIAATMNAEAELSRLFRRQAVELAAGRTDLPTIFLNTHPVEMARPGLLESLEELRAIAPQLDLALEIHESVLTHPAAIAELRALLLERNIALAYDDFGAREDRRKLLELSDAPPHYLKFDQRFVKDLDQAPTGKRRLLRSLLLLAEELRVKTVAEGIETGAEARACAELGFTHGQGFHIGRPRPVDQI
ncbi:MAG TPA: EAL domain-containing protein, partial [Vicinamibacteria bacterium]|nr:EAL domain-containing protein [Vicinamibacteria bacterium]